MRGLVAVIPALVAGLATACASPTDVRFDDRLDFSRFQTWDWLPGEPVSIDAPIERAPGLERQLSRSVSQALAGRGLARAPGRADLRVGVALKVWRGVQVVQRTGAMETLHSYHNTHSFMVQTAETRRTPVERFVLQVHVVDPIQGRVIWQGRTENRFGASRTLGLDVVIAQLLEEFPAR